MAALSADRRIPQALEGFASGIGYILDVPVGVTEEIYQGSFVTLDSGDKFGAPLSAGEAFYGLSLERVTGGAANGDVTCKCLCEGVISHTLSSVAQADIGKPVYASDDQTLTLTSGTNSPIGFLVNVPATGTAIVRLNRPRITPDIATVTNFTDNSLTFAADGAAPVAGDSVATLLQTMVNEGLLMGTFAA